MIPLWQITLLGHSTEEFLFEHNDLSIYVGVTCKEPIQVSIKVHVPGHFSWGCNRMPVESFTHAVRDTLFKVLSQMHEVNADGTQQIVAQLKAIWK